MAKAMHGLNNKSMIRQTIKNFCCLLSSPLEFLSCTQQMVVGYELMFDEMPSHEPDVIFSSF